MVYPIKSVTLLSLYEFKKFRSYSVLLEVQQLQFCRQEIAWSTIRRDHWAFIPPVKERHWEVTINLPLTKSTLPNIKVIPISSWSQYKGENVVLMPR